VGQVDSRCAPGPLTLRRLGERWPPRRLRQLWRAAVGEMYGRCQLMRTDDKVKPRPVYSHFARHSMSAASVAAIRKGERCAYFAESERQWTRPKQRLTRSTAGRASLVGVRPRHGLRIGRDAATRNVRVAGA
jgi:hypothetical protein